MLIPWRTSTESVAVLASAIFPPASPVVSVAAVAPLCPVGSGLGPELVTGVVCAVVALGESVPVASVGLTPCTAPLSAELVMGVVEVELACIAGCATPDD